MDRNICCLFKSQIARELKSQLASRAFFARPNCELKSSSERHLVPVFYDLTGGLDFITMVLSIMSHLGALFITSLITFSVKMHNYIIVENYMLAQVHFELED